VEVEVEVEVVMVVDIGRVRRPDIYIYICEWKNWRAVER